MRHYTSLAITTKHPTGKGLVICGKRRQPRKVPGAKALNLDEPAVMLSNVKQLIHNDMIYFR